MDELTKTALCFRIMFAWCWYTHPPLIVYWTLLSTSKSASKVVLSRMQLTLHLARPTPHGASPLVQAIPTWSVKTRRAPSRRCRDARVYGHTTTAMHNMSASPCLGLQNKERWRVVFLFFFFWCSPAPTVLPCMSFPSGTVYQHINTMTNTSTTFFHALLEVGF